MKKSCMFPAESAGPTSVVKVCAPMMGWNPLRHRKRPPSRVIYANESLSFRFPREISICPCSTLPVKVGIIGELSDDRTMRREHGVFSVGTIAPIESVCSSGKGPPPVALCKMKNPATKEHSTEPDWLSKILKKRV